MAANFFTTALVVATLAISVIAGARLPYPADHPNIVTVSQANFQQEVLLTTLPVTLLFYGPRDKKSKALAPVFEEAAEALVGLTEFKAMDSQAQDGAEIAKMFGVPSYPSLVFFNPEMHPVAGGQEGQFMKQPVGFNPEGMTAERLVKAILEQTDGHQIDTVADEIDFVDFTGRYSKHDMPKVLLVQRNSEVTSPAFKALSHKFRYGAHFGVVPPSTDAAVYKQLGVKTGEDGKPESASLLTFVNPNEIETHADAAEKSLDDLAQIIDKVAFPAQKRQQMQAVYLEEDKVMRKKEAEEAKMSKALKVVQVTTKEEWEKECVKRKKGNCVAVFVDGFSNPIPTEMLTNVSRKIAQRSSTACQVVVIDGLYNYQLVQEFGITDGLPAVVYFQPSKKMYQTHIGSFQEKNIVAFYLQKVGKAKAKSYNPKKLPEFAVSPTEESEDNGEVSDEM